MWTRPTAPRFIGERPPRAFAPPVPVSNNYAQVRELELRLQRAEAAAYQAEKNATFYRTRAEALVSDKIAAETQSAQRCRALEARVRALQTELAARSTIVASNHHYQQHGQVTSNTGVHGDIIESQGEEHHKATVAALMVQVDDLQQQLEKEVHARQETRAREAELEERLQCAEEELHAYRELSSACAAQTIDVELMLERRSEEIVEHVVGGEAGPPGICAGVQPVETHTRARVESFFGQVEHGVADRKEQVGGYTRVKMAGSGAKSANAVVVWAQSSATASTAADMRTTITNATDTQLEQTSSLMLSSSSSEDDDRDDDTCIGHINKVAGTGTMATGTRKTRHRAHNMRDSYAGEVQRLREEKALLAAELKEVNFMLDLTAGECERSRKQLGVMKKRCEALEGQLRKAIARLLAVERERKEKGNSNGPGCATSADVDAVTVGEGVMSGASARHMGSNTSSEHESQSVVEEEHLSNSSNGQDAEKSTRGDSTKSEYSTPDSTPAQQQFLQATQRATNTDVGSSGEESEYSTPEKTLPAEGENEQEQQERQSQSHGREQHTESMHEGAILWAVPGDRDSVAANVAPVEASCSTPLIRNSMSCFVGENNDRLITAQHDILRTRTVASKNSTPDSDINTNIEHGSDNTGTATQAKAPTPRTAAITPATSTHKHNEQNDKDTGAKAHTPEDMAATASTTPAPNTHSNESKREHVKPGALATPAPATKSGATTTGTGTGVQSSCSSTATMHTWLRAIVEAMPTLGAATTASEQEE